MIFIIDIDNGEFGHGQTLEAACNNSYDRGFDDTDLSECVVIDGHCLGQLSLQLSIVPYPGLEEVPPATTDKPKGKKKK